MATFEEEMVRLRVLRSKQVKVKRGPKPRYGLRSLTSSERQRLYRARKFAKEKP